MLEEFSVLIRGLVLGVVIAAPVGPVGLLCIRRTIQKGLIIGFATGLGAAFADALFSAIAAFGVAAIIELIHKYDQTIHIIGGLFLLAVAWHTWRDPPKMIKPSMEAGVGGILKALISGFVITLSNPVTLFGVFAVVATFGGLNNHMEAVIIVGGIFVGSMAWWMLLSGGISLVRKRVTEDRILWINRITAFALAMLAIWALGKGITGYMK